MRRTLALGMAGILLAAAVSAGAAMSGPPPRKKPHKRTVVVVHKGFPLHRPPRQVVVRTPRVTVRVAPSVFLPAVVWGGVVLATAPSRDVLVWEDGETLDSDEGWTEFTLNCDTTGKRLWLEVVRGRVQFDWAEIVFGNGNAQVVDMKEWIRGPGHYELLNFADGRRVDHIRLVARSVSRETRVVLKMQK